MFVFECKLPCSCIFVPIVTDLVIPTPPLTTNEPDVFDVESTVENRLTLPVNDAFDVM